TNLQAALGVAQLERLDEFVARKRHMGALYTELLAGLGGVQFPLARTDAADNVYWVYGLVADERHGDAASIMRRLAERGIGCRPFFCPLHQQPVLRQRGWYENQQYPVAERLYRQGFYIPSGLGLSVPQIHEVANAVRAVLR
ncbi:MAG: aminotransferase DegT, partial [Burkholderiales bacterium]